MPEVFLEDQIESEKEKVQAGEWDALARAVTLGRDHSKTPKARTPMWRTCGLTCT